MTRDDLAKLIYHGPRIGFDVGWDHKNIREETRDLYRETADRVAAALGVTFDDSPSQPGGGGDCGEGLWPLIDELVDAEKRAAYHAGGDHPNSYKAQVREMERAHKAREAIDSAIRAEAATAQALEGIADQMELLFTVRLDDPMSNWSAATREAFRARDLRHIIQSIRDAAQTLRGGQP